VHPASTVFATAADSHGLPFLLHQAAYHTLLRAKDRSNLQLRCFFGFSDAAGAVTRAPTKISGSVTLAARSLNPAVRACSIKKSPASLPGLLLFRYLAGWRGSRPPRQIQLALQFCRRQSSRLQDAPTVMRRICLTIKSVPLGKV
jgi:hypothetical protein